VDILHKCFNHLLFGRVRIVVKSIYYLRLSVCLSVVRLSRKNKSPPNGRIFIIFGVSEFVENLWRNL